jgi:two-component system nitrogen regulation response regulator NtrX
VSTGEARDSALVVDRDELVRWSVAEGLKDLGCSVAVAEEVREGLHVPSPAVALLELDSSRGDGLAAVDALRRRHPRSIVVLMASEPTPELCRRARERGAFRVLAKPFSIDALLATVREALAHVRGTNPPPPPRSGGLRLLQTGGAREY